MRDIFCQYLGRKGESIVEEGKEEASYGWKVSVMSFHFSFTLYEDCVSEKSYSMTFTN